MTPVDRRPLSILLAALIALQSYLAGVAVCSKGGCCHAEGQVAHVEDEHGHDHDHEHSTLVSKTGAPHPCDCTDREFDGGQAIRAPRDEAPTLAPASYVLVDPGHEVHPSIASTTEAFRPRARGDAADRQRLVVVRCTRLQL